VKVVHLRTAGLPSEMVVTEQPRPSPAAHEVVIQQPFAAVNHIDVLLERGLLPPAMMPALPVVPGVEGAGIVTAVGQAISHLEVGDRCMWLGQLGAGGYAEYVCLDGALAVEVPQTLDLAVAASTLVNFATALHMLENVAHVIEGDTVLVRGASGGVGRALIQLATDRGVRVIGVCSASRSHEVRTHGAAATIDRHVEFATLEPAVRALAPQGVQVAFNPVGGSTVTEDLRLLAPFGELVLFGFLGGLPTGTLQDAVLANFNHSVALRGSDLYTLYRAQPARVPALLGDVRDRLVAGRIRPNGATCFPLERVADAHAAVLAGSEAKVLLQFADP